MLHKRDLKSKGGNPRPEAKFAQSNKEGPNPAFLMVSLQIRGN